MQLIDRLDRQTSVSRHALPPRRLNFDSSVPRKLVHRAAVCEVFLTDSEADGAHSFFAGQLPRVHAYYNDHTRAGRFYDGLLLVEVGRQAAILFAHRYCGADLDARFVFNTASFHIVDQEALRIGPNPGSCEIAATTVMQKFRKGLAFGVTLEMVMTVDGTPAAGVTLSYQWMPARSWGYLRQRGRAGLGLPAEPVMAPVDLSQRLAPDSVARNSHHNVVIGSVLMSSDGLAADVLLDYDHPCFFDHPLDHVPAMVQFEAIRQVAVTAATKCAGLHPSQVVLLGITVAFTRFGEFELPTLCIAGSPTRQGESRLATEVAITQDGIQITVGFVELGLTHPSPVPAPSGLR